MTEWVRRFLQTAGSLMTCRGREGVSKGGNRFANEFLGLKEFGQWTFWALRNFHFWNASAAVSQVQSCSHRVTTSAKTPMLCTTGDVPSMSTRQQLLPWFNFILVFFFTEQFLLLWFFKEESRSICCRKEQESYFPLTINQMNNHSKEKFHSQHWTFCNNHGKRSSRAPLQLQILHRSITNVLQNTLKIKLHCQVIEFCASGMLLALHFFLINVKHPVILKRFSHHFLNLPTPLDGIVSNTKIPSLPRYKHSKYRKIRELPNLTKPLITESCQTLKALQSTEVTWVPLTGIWTGPLPFLKPAENPAHTANMGDWL